MEIAIEPRDRLQLEQSSNAFISCICVYPFDNNLEVSLLENGRTIMPYDDRITAKTCPQMDERRCTNVTLSITSNTTQNNTSIVCEYRNWHTGVTVARSDPVLVTIKPPITEPPPTEQPTTEDTSATTPLPPSPMPTSVQQEPESDSRGGGSTNAGTVVWVSLVAVIMIVAIIIIVLMVLLVPLLRARRKKNDLEVRVESMGMGHGDWNGNRKFLANISAHTRKVQDSK